MFPDVHDSIMKRRRVMAVCRRTKKSPLRGFWAEARNAQMCVMNFVTR